MTNGVRGDRGGAEIRKIFDRAEDMGPPGGEPPAEDERPVVRYSPGGLPAALEEFEAVLVAAGPGPIFQRAGQLVHIADRPARRSDGAIDIQPAIVPIDQAALGALAAEIADYEKWDVRANDWRRIDPPTKLLEAYFAKARWRLADLHGILFAPTLRHDGSLLHRRGYDARTGLYLIEEV